MHYDLIIVGAGIIGTAVAYEYAMRHPGGKIALIDKSAQISRHQSGRNSGVIHAGVYYPPGSLKARFCRQGLEDTLAFCRDNGLPAEQCGKLIVATSEDERARLATLYSRCEQNDLQPEMVSARKITQLEPNIRGVEAVLVGHSGITDYQTIAQCMLAKAQEKAQLNLCVDHQVSGIDEQDKQVVVTAHHHTDRIRIAGQRLICCAGVHADRLIRMQGIPCDFQIMPFKGEYFRLHQRFDHVTKRLIYPVPDPAMPFLGVHLTKMIGGFTTVGPNAVLATGREAYRIKDTSVKDILDMAGYAGLWKLLWRYRQSVVSELRSSISKKYYASLIQRYCPTVTEHDFAPYRPGIRAQAVRTDGSLVSDFLFTASGRTLHVGNAPSPAATSAMPIARAILARADAL